MPQIWAIVDIGKEHHHCVVVDERGERLLSRRVFNDERALLELIADVLALSEDALWAVDTNHGGAALLIGLLLNHDQPMVYITGLAVHQASTAYRGQGKTDEKDAFVIADQARMRQDLGLLRPGDEIAVDLRTLTARRLDLVNDRTRQTNRLRAQLLEFFPALERALNLSKKGPVVLLTGYQAPAAIRRSGASRIGTWLKNRKVKNAAALAETAVEAAKSQHTALPGETLAAAMVARIDKGVLALNEEITELDALIEGRFNDHRHATVIRSLPAQVGDLAGEGLLAIVRIERDERPCHDEDLVDGRQCGGRALVHTPIASRPASRAFAATRSTATQSSPYSSSAVRSAAPLARAKTSTSSGTRPATAACAAAASVSSPASRRPATNRTCALPSPRPRPGRPL
ncbi:IS110 family transposase [Streptomyces sp. CWNU-52B]|uniref:IS110 family transposase n=1 Tax=unclassified Streptomyces TaxID=2593676 RepID=UPI0039C0E79C